MADKSSTTASPPSHTHHRQRLRDRAVAHGLSTLADYEVLELLLFSAIPRRDTKPTAKALLQKFKSFRGIMAADIDALTEVSGIGRDTALFLKTAAEVTIRMAKEEAFNDGPILRSWEAVITFLKDEIGMKANEHFIALYLGSSNKLLKHENIAEGTVNRVNVYPREIVKSALKYNATSVIIAHNHPSGDLSPSKQDITMTNAIRDALASVDITLHDHIIVGSTQYTSFKQLGLL